MFPERIETERLEMERLTTKSVSPRTLYEAAGRPADEAERIFRYLPWEPFETLDDAADHIEKRDRQWADRERATYTIRPREGEAGAGEFAGTGSLILDWDHRVGMPGIWLRQAFWGRGYAGERARALIDLAFETLDLDCVVIPLEADNDRSKAAVEGYVDAHGGRHDGLLRHDATRPGGRVVDRHRYTITQAEYRDATDGGRGRPSK